MKVRFDSDTEALKSRLQLNAEGALYNLEDWIIQQVHPHAGMRILDLGCGTGKQVFALANLVSTSGSILGLDLSKNAVEEVRRRAEREHLTQVKSMQGSLDDCIGLLKDYRFDIVLSSYALYYAKDMKRLLCELRQLLNSGGQVFVCGPGRGTNQEIIDLINQVVSDPTLKAGSIEDFISESDIREIGGYYSRHETVRLDNAIRFSSTNDLLQWWKNHNSFIPEAYDIMAQAIGSKLSEEREFTLTKNVLGVNFYA